MSEFGFAVLLDAGFAKKCLNIELNDRAKEFLIECANHTISSILPNRVLYADSPYHFAKTKDSKESILLQYCEVPGVNCCSIGVGYEGIRDIENSYTGTLRYSPHNIDDIYQSYSLLSIWLRWCNAAMHMVGEGQL